MAKEAGKWWDTFLLHFFYHSEWFKIYFSLGKGAGYWLLFASILFIWFPSCQWQVKCKFSLHLLMAGTKTGEKNRKANIWTKLVGIFHTERQNMLEDICPWSSKWMAIDTMRKSKIKNANSLIIFRPEGTFEKSLHFLTSFIDWEFSTSQFLTICTWVMGMSECRTDGCIKPHS